MHQIRESSRTRLTRRTAFLLGLAMAVPVVAPRAASAQDQDARPLLEQTATTMAGIQSFHFEMTTPSGKSLVVDQLELAGIDGDIQRPDRFRVSFTAKASIVSITVKVIGIGTQLWVTDPMARDEAWIEVSTGDVGAVPLPDILNPDRLLQSAVDVIQEPTIAGQEEIDGTMTTRVEGMFDPRQVNQQVNELTGTPVPELTALTGDKAIPVRLWIDETYRLRRVEFAGPLTAADEGDVVRRFDLTKIDEPIDIQPPA